MIKRNYPHNPFCGISTHEVQQIVVPKKEIVNVIPKLKDREEFIIQLLGKKGRGKTLHLNYIHQNIPESSIVYLEKGADLSRYKLNTQNVLCIDSIHHLSMLQRLQLYKSYPKLIFTSHRNRSWELKFLGKSVHTVPFKGINEKVLSEIICKRLDNAQYKNLTIYEKIEIRNQSQNLIKKFGDDYRSIINYLYDHYQ